MLIAFWKAFDRSEGVKLLILTSSYHSLPLIPAKWVTQQDFRL